MYISYTNPLKNNHQKWIPCSKNADFRMYILAYTLSRLISFVKMHYLALHKHLFGAVVSCVKAAGGKSREREHSLQKADCSQTLQTILISVLELFFQSPIDYPVYLKQTAAKVFKPANGNLNTQISPICCTSRALNLCYETLSPLHFSPDLDI